MPAQQKSKPQHITVSDRSALDPFRGFVSPRQFLTAVMRNAEARSVDQISAPGLRPLFVPQGGDPLTKALGSYMLPIGYHPGSMRATAGSDEQGGYADRYGAFMQQTQLAPGMLGAVDQDPTASRTTKPPMDQPIMQIVARTDKDHTTSVTGGLVVSRTAETLSRSTSRMTMEMIELKAASLFGVSFSTDELADSVKAFIALLAEAFSVEVAATLLNEKIRGNGANQYLGVLNSSAKITVDKETGQSAATINSENILKMAARTWQYDDAIWLANPETRTQLAKLFIAIGTAGTPLLQPATAPGMPQMLYGVPIYFKEMCSALGTEGDLLCVNWSQFLECTYQPLTGAESIHVRFDRMETCFKFWTRNAGAPWWRAALTPRNGTATLSPIVSLQTRS